jgi:tetratricopeptide (TPR) repeat protein
LAVVLVSLVLFAAPVMADGIDDYHAGLEAQRRGDLARAARHYVRAIKFPGTMSNDELAAAYNKVATVFIELGVFHQAIYASDQAIRLKPGEAEPFYNRGRAHSEWEKGRRPDRDAALRDLSEAIRLKPDYAEAFAERGRVVMESRQGKGRQIHEALTKRAWDDLDHAVRLAPTSSAVHYIRAIVHISLNDTTAALSDLDRAINLDLDDAKSYYQRGSIYLQQNKPEQAIADLNKAIELRRDYGSAIEARAFAHERVGNLESAEHDYRDRIGQQPNRSGLTFRRGVVRFCLGKFEHAAADFSNSADGWDDDNQRSKNVLWAHVSLRRAGRPAALREELLRARDASPCGERGRRAGKYCIGQRNAQVASSPLIELFLGELTPQETIAYVEDYNRFQPLSGQIALSEAHFFVGEYLLLEGDKEGAAESFRRSIESSKRGTNGRSAAKAELQRIATQ